MFDSSKQPDSESTIDFLHNDASSGSKSSKSKKTEPVEYVRVDSTQTAASDTSPSWFHSAVKRMVSGAKGLFRTKTFTAKQTHPKENLADASQTFQQKRLSDSEVHVRASDLTTSPPAREAPSDSPLSQARPAIVEEKTKGRPIEKIPLDKFRDLERSEGLKRVAKPDDRRPERGALRGISFHKDRGEGGDDMDVNLLPEQRRSVSPQAKRGVAVALLSLEFIGLLVGFLALQAKADGRLLGSRELESQQTLLDIQVKRYREVVKEASHLQQRAVMLRQILEQRPDILGVVAWLESNTIDSVYFEGLNISNTGSVRIRAVAPNAEDAAHQMNIFASTKSWKEVDISSITLENDQENSFRVSFDVQLSEFLGLEKSAL